MEKEFEALKRIRQETAPATYNPDFDKKECCDVIEQALQHLEAIENSNPSETLDKLLDRANHDEYLSRIGTEEAIKFLNENQMFVTSIKQALIKAQDQEKELKQLKVKYADILINNEFIKYIDDNEKVLKIIFEKNVDIIMIRMSETLDKYNRMIYKDNFNRKELTQEEFELLKRYLENE